jgi:hypothetical protein
VICGGIGVSDAYYCKECTIQEKDVRSALHACCVPLAMPAAASNHLRGALRLSAERRLSKDHKPGQREDGPALRPQDVWE